LLGHLTDINKREQDHRKMLQEAGYVPIGAHDEAEDGTIITEYDEDGDALNNGKKVPKIDEGDKPRPGHPHFKEDKPKTPNMNFLFSMIIDVYFRDKFMQKDLDLESNAMIIESDLRDHEIDYQQLNLRDQKYVQILCNDPEEREHIKHLLLKNK